MLSREKVILMTKLASYEEHEGKENTKVESYFRGDYIALQVLKTVICTTIAFGLLLGLYFVYDFDNLMGNIYKMDLMSFVKNILVYYGIVLLVSLGASCLFSIWKYSESRDNQDLYYRNLRKLSRMYKKNKN